MVEKKNNYVTLSDALLACDPRGGTGGMCGLCDFGLSIATFFFIDEFMFTCMLFVFACV